MGANDELLHPWISPECKIMAQCVEFSKPVVGVCLGGQMLSRALGGEVVRNRSAEVGWFPIEINSEGENDRILGNVGASPLVYHWHYDTFSLPPGSTLLAHSFACERQAYRIGENAYGFQFHPEADHQLILEWLAVDGVENEIEDTRREHGITTVQDAETQRSRAEQGEKSSLRIATALSQLFKNRDYPGKKSDLHARLDLWIPNRTALEIEFNNSNGDPVVLQGHVTMLFEIPDGEFLIFTENSTLRWPIRLDFIRKIKPAG